MSETTFFEITLLAADFKFGSRDEIEDPLEYALQQAGLGAVTGGGSGMGIANIDIEVTDPQRGLALIREVIQSLGVAPSTLIRQTGFPSIEHSVYDSSASCERKPFMFRVIDTIQFDATLYGHHPELRERYGSEGLLAILDSADATEVPVYPGTVMRVHRPDGTTVEHTTTLGERPSTAVGLFFPHATADDIPRLSTLEPIPTPEDA